jgi:glyoxylase-like metal-dependent hydrolase (beta-lactamase superfamily II)
MDIKKLTYKATNCYLLPSDDGWVMIDAGWPDTLSTMLQLLMQNDIYVNDINYLIVTHFHPDHAGLTQNLKDYGTKLLLHECQVPYVNRLNHYYKKNPQARFKDIVTGDNIILTSSNSRDFLSKIGIQGELIQTPGHSDDSISLIIDNCCAFTGDLPELKLSEAYHDELLSNSWRSIRDFHIKTIYPAHGNYYDISEDKDRISE